MEFNSAVSVIALNNNTVVSTAVNAERTLDYTNSSGLITINQVGDMDNSNTEYHDSADSINFAMILIHLVLTVASSGSRTMVTDGFSNIQSLWLLELMPVYTIHNDSGPLVLAKMVRMQLEC